MRNLKLTVTLIMVMTGTFMYAQITSVSTLGSAISTKTAQQWMDNYKKQFAASSEHVLGKEMMLHTMRAAGVAGIYLIKGLDDQGNERFIIMPADDNGAIIEGVKPMLTFPYEMSCKAETVGQVLNEVTMQSMIRKFSHEQKDAFGAHVYGIKAFEHLLLQPEATALYIAKGLDESSEEHLVLAALDKKGEVMWANVWNHGSGIFSVFYSLFASK
jgi:hypothetical protein